MKPETGTKVIASARSYIGSHYINGGYGATPGRDDGCPCRKGGVNLIYSADQMNPNRHTDPRKNLAVYAAQMTINKYCVCAGNYKTYPGGRVAHPNDEDLTVYLAKLKALDAAATYSVPPSEDRYFAKFYTPRRAFGPGPGGDINGLLVWGEACTGIRHFDCVGFISFCIWEATGTVMQLGIDLWRKSPNNPAGGTVFELATSKPAQLLDGDILIKQDHHIGFVTKDGAIIEARDTDLGVCATSDRAFTLTSPGTWTHLVRLPI